MPLPTGPAGLRSIAAALLFILPVSVVYAEPAGTVLSLAEAERLALQTDPLIDGYAAEADSLRDQAVADAQLPDPKFKMGLMNLPVDSFSRSAEAMTQLQVGIQQAFPRGDSLEYTGERTAAMARAETMRREDRRLQVLRSVRRSYLDIYYHIHKQSLLEENRALFRRLLEITERQYAVGRDAQHDVMRAQLELSLLDNRLLEARGDERAARADLAQWIADEHARRSLAEAFPELPTLPPMIHIRDGISHHPRIRISNAYVDAREYGVAVAEEQYKPGWMLDITYGERTGSNIGGADRPDMLSAMVLVDIPLFTGKRQDKRLSAARKQVAAARFSRSDQLRRLVRDAESEYARWRQLDERYELYQKRALSEADRNTEVTLKAYQNNVTDFTTLMRASLTELDIRLQMLQVQVERAKQRAELLYFAGEES